jgi:hypothetical protein
MVRTRSAKAANVRVGMSIVMVCRSDPRKTFRGQYGSLVRAFFETSVGKDFMSGTRGREG